MEIDWIDFLVTPLVGAVVGFAVWYFQSRIETLRREQEKWNDDRRKVYTEILDPFIRIFAGIKNPKETQKAMQKILSLEYKRTSFEFSLIGADEVVESFNTLMQYVYSMEESDTADAAALMQLWGNFLLQIRRNLGNSKTKLTAADMLSSQIKDIHELIK